jgi:molecular chaperone GrpE
MTADQGWPSTPQGSPGTPGREAEEPRPAGPDEDAEGALRAKLSSTPSTSSPPAGGGAAADTQGSDAGASSAGDELEQDIAALLSDTEQKRDEYLELAKRTQADFENYRKRMAAEVGAAATRGKVELAAQLIGVIDNLERALAAAGVEPGSDKAPAEPLAEGFFLTYRELCAVLERAGIESFDPAGEGFDPAWHEALQKLPVEGTEPGTVVETLQKGYRLGEQLIRPARVVVSE